MTFIYNILVPYTNFNKSHPTFQYIAGKIGLTISHYNDVIMSTMASQITSLIIVYSSVYSGVDQRKHQSSASVASVRGIRRWPVNSPHKGPVTRKMFPFDDVIMGRNVVQIRGHVSFFILSSIRSIFTSSRSTREALLVKMYSTQFFQYRGL